VTLRSCITGMATVALVALCVGVSPVAAQPHAEGGAAPGALAPTGGQVVETMNSGGYTYVQVDDGAKKFWAAGPQCTVSVGDRVILPDGMVMRDFASKTLGRTFDVIYFASAIQVVSAQALDAVAAAHAAADHALPGHGMSGSTAAAAEVDLANIKKADGGQTVAELFANKAALAGKDVVVRGRIVKYTAAVMGKNWLHVRDGSGSAGTNDLTVSTSTDAAVGNLVLVRGKLGTDKDLGAGYHYDIIIEDASVAVE
jgi:hypothetical protein